MPDAEARPLRRNRWEVKSRVDFQSDYKAELKN